MYKDVWKKFGVKIFVVFCSILLVGGVAVAAPHLQAEGTTDLADLTFSKTVTQPYKVDESALNDGVIQGEKQFPENVQADDGTTLKRGLDYRVVETDGISEAGDSKQFTIMPLGSSSILSNNSSSASVTLEITKNMSIPSTKLVTKYNNSKYKELAGITGELSDNHLVVDRTPATFSVDGWTVGISDFTDSEGNMIPLTYGTDYQLVSNDPADLQINTLGKNFSIGFTLKNFQITGTFNPTVYKNMNSPDILPSGDKTENITVTDNGTTIDVGDYSVIPQTTNSWNIIGNHNNGKYIGSRPYTNQSAISNFKPWYHSYTYDYDTRGTIENPPAEVRNGGENGTVLKEGVDYEIDQYRILDSNNKPVEGATAGNVFFRIRGIGTYDGGESSGSYTLTRSFVKNGNRNPNLTLKLDPEGDFEYDGAWKQKTLTVYFDGQEDKKLKPDRDYEIVNYTLKKDSDGTEIVTTNVQDLTEAGTVDIQIRGKNFYEGTLKGSMEVGGLRYRIKPLSVRGNRQIILSQSVFELTTNVKENIFNSAYLDKVPETGDREPVSKYSRKYSFSYDEEGNNPINDNDWNTLRPNTTYYIQVEFYGNYKDTLSAGFTVQEYDPSFININLGACHCGATGNQKHFYTGLPHTPEITSVTYKTTGMTEAIIIDPGEYEESINYGDGKNVDKGKVTVTLPISDKVTGETSFEIEARDVADGTFRLSEADGFYDEGGIRKHKYTGYTKVLQIKEVDFQLNGTNTILPLQSKDYTIGELYVYDEATKKGTERVASAQDIVTGKKYCYRLDLKGNNLTSTDRHAYTEPFEFDKRPINAEGEKGIDFQVKPKTDYTGSESESDFRTHLTTPGNLVITDKELGEVLRSQDYSIKDIEFTKRIHEDSVVTFTVEATAQGCYSKEKTEVELYVGRNITLTKLKEKKHTDKSVQLDPVEPGQEAISGTIILDDEYGSLNGIPFVLPGEKESDSKVSLRYFRNAGAVNPTEVLGKGAFGVNDGGKYSVEPLTSIPEPDDPNDSSGIQYIKATITGKNGYYGKIVLKIPISKSSFGDYKIVFHNGDGTTGNTNNKEVLDDNVYTGKPVTPSFDVVRKSVTSDDPDTWDPDDVLTRGVDYYIPEGDDGWFNNTLANEDKSGNGNKARLRIRGLYGYDGMLEKVFTIYKRNIGVERDVDINGTITKHMVLNEDAGFEIQGWQGGHSYDYTPYTKTEKGEEKYVIPQLKLFYGDYELKANVDYRFSCLNNINACCYSDANVTYDQMPKVWFRTVDNSSSNFKGEFYDTFEIQPIILSQDDETKAKVVLEYPDDVFTGHVKEPSVKVVLHRGGDPKNPYTIEYVPDGDFAIKYNENRFVSAGGGTGSDISNPWLTSVEVTGTGNLQGTVYKQFVIWGQFEPDPNGDGYKNSRMDVKPKILAYSPTASAEDLKAGCTVIFNEKADGEPESAYTGSDRSKGRSRELTTIEYTVKVANRIGADLDARVDSAVDYFKGGKDFKMTIQGNLGADYINYTVSPIGYSPEATTVDLSKFLTVTYDTNNGQQALSYGDDYVFETTPTANLGYNSVMIEPAVKGSGNDWLIGKKQIEYYLTTSLDTLVLENVQPSYPYAHGQPVLKPEDIIVKLGNDRLTYGVDYNIEIVGDATSVGTHTIIVTSANEERFSGKKEQSFSITKYNLEDAVKDKLITVNYINDEKNPYYTGSTVVPTVTSVTIATSAGALYTLEDGTKEGKPAEYEIIAGTQGDHVNWTSGDVKPDFIVSGRGNYTGEISYEYSIKRKDIGDANEVTVAPIDDIYYNNGRDITPVPSIQYRGRDLSGIRHSGNAGDYVDWKDYSQHFTYQYSTKIDLKSTGTKEITIRGIGNFTGETTVSYKVIPLNIKDTELVFTGETPVYDSKPQTPAFQLVYAGDVIMQWTGTRAISDFIRSTPEVAFGNNTNATGDEPATVRISITDENDNYQGVKEATFTILPASLDSHTKFLYRPVGGNANEDLKNYKLNLDFIGVGSTVKPTYAQSGEEELGEGQLGIYYDFSQKANHGAFLLADQDYTIEYKYVEPDTDDVDVREDYQDPDISFAGKVKVTITGTGNYADTASFWYYIGKDISADATISMNPTTAVYNSQVQAPKVTVSGVEGLKYIIAKYKDEVAVENLIEDRDFVNAGNYFIRIEGDPRNGTYATKPYTLTYTITPRAFSNNLVIDGFKREYSYTGYEIRPVGISVTDYIDKVKYKLTEDVDYTLTYTNNLNAGTAYINVEGKRNFSGKATANFMITSSTISSGGTNGSNSFLDQGTGEISGATAVSPSNVNMSMDTIDAMYYTGSPVYPKVSIAGMTENVDYTVTFSNNVEVGTAVATINGIGNNNGTIIKNFRIIAQLSKCTISPIPAQQYTGSEVKPSLTVRCGNSILMEGTDYTVTYSNNVNIGTATATIRALNNANYTGSASVRFSIGNDVGGFIISGYAPSYAYTGNAITPGVVVETGSRTLTPGTDYTVSYSNNINAGTATITVTGTGRYSGTQTANFIIEPKSMQSLTTTDIADRTYTGDAYTPDITVSDGGKVLTKGVDYTVTYTNNTNPGTASILIQGTSSNYSGTKVVSFKIAAVAVKGLKASSIKYNSLKLRWTNQGYADGYQICDSQSKLVKTVKTNSATITGLTAGKTYKYKVRSYIRNADGTRSYGAFSSVLSATTKLRTPTVKVVSNAKGQARISWSKVSGATGYEIYYKKTAGAKYKKLKTVNNANVRVCTVRGMKSGDRAYFRVRAFRKNGSKKVYSSLNPLKVITVK